MPLEDLAAREAGRHRAGDGVLEQRRRSWRARRGSRFSRACSGCTRQRSRHACVGDDQQDVRRVLRVSGASAAYSSPQALRPSAAAPAAPVCSARRRVKRGPRAIVLLVHGASVVGMSAIGAPRGRRTLPAPQHDMPCRSCGRRRYFTVTGVFEWRDPRALAPHRFRLLVVLIGVAHARRDRADVAGPRAAPLPVGRHAERPRDRDRRYRPPLRRDGLARMQAGQNPPRQRRRQAARPGSSSGTRTASIRRCASATRSASSPRRRCRATTRRTSPSTRSSTISAAAR